MGDLIPVCKPHTFELLELKWMFSTIMASGMFTNNGKNVQTLETQIEKRLDVPHFVAMSSGTAALEAAVSLLFQPGDIIAIPSYTFVAVATAVARCGCVPIFIDIDLNTWTMSYDDYCDCHGAIDGVIVANCFGVSPDHRFWKVDHPLVYDNAEGFGTHTGIWGDVDTYSFHATKIVNGAEGGGIACEKKHLAHLHAWRNFGFDGISSGVTCVGTNAKMSEFHAALTSASLLQESVQISARRRLLERYKNNLWGTVQFQAGDAYNCVVLVERRDEVAERLADNGFDSRPYFYPIHKMGPFRQDRELPNTIYVSDRALALPLWEGMSIEMVNRICDIVKGE